VHLFLLAPTVAVLVTAAVIFDIGLAIATALLITGAAALSTRRWTWLAENRRRLLDAVG
jgi:hypothetical protein